MYIKPIICTQCGGTIKLEYLQKILTCPFCGTSFFTSYDSSNQKIPITESNEINTVPMDVNIERVKETVINISYVDLRPITLKHLTQEKENSEIEQNILQLIKFLSTLLLYLTSLYNRFNKCNYNYPFTNRCSENATISISLQNKEIRTTF